MELKDLMFNFMIKQEKAKKEVEKLNETTNSFIIKNFGDKNE